MVEGEEKNFQYWYDLVVANRNVTDNAADVLLVYGTYAAPFYPQVCNSTEEMPAWSAASCRTVYIPDTTLTEGLNELAEFAYCEEQRRQQEFSFWIFADDDARLTCPRQDRNLNDCWTRFQSFLVNEVEEKVPETPIVALYLWIGASGLSFSKRT
jgi:hypothetical protein